MSNQQQLTNQFRKAKTRPAGKAKGVKKEKQSVHDHSASTVIKECDDIIYLKQFDLDTKFGPSLGLTRLERWERAYELGLNPPSRIKQLIESNVDDDTYVNPLWNSITLLTQATN